MIRVIWAGGDRRIRPLVRVGPDTKVLKMEVKGAFKAAKFAAVSLIAFIAFCGLVSLAATDVSAETVIKIIDGHVYDPNGDPLEGADVSVSIYNGATWINTYSTTTDQDGFYTITIAPSDWNVGYNITVEATFNSEQVSDTIVADATFGQTVDLQFPLGIPQFGTIIGFFVAAGLIAVVAIVFLKKKR